MHDVGLEPVDGWDGSVMTADGRPVVMVRDGVAYAPVAEEFAERVRDAIAEAEKREADRRASQPKPVREGIAAATCPQMSGGRPCGGTLNRSPVCPSCVTGRMGYRYRYTCESCGCDIVTREELR